MTRVLHGQSGAPGIALGTTVRLELTDLASRAALPVEVDVMEHFKRVQMEVVAQLQGVARELRDEGKRDEAAILDAQALLANDVALTEEVRRRAVDQQMPLADAIHAATEAMTVLLSSLDDPYLRERAVDVLAVGKELQQVLMGTTPVDTLLSNAIVISHDLTPLETTTLRKRGIAGLATAGGTSNGHVAILARALGIPAVVGLGEDLMDVPAGVPAILAASSGLLLIEPTAAEVTLYAAERAAMEATNHHRLAVGGLLDSTHDGSPFELWANIGDPSEARTALRYSAGGIGLLRTEFLLLDRMVPASEDEQYAAYAEVLQTMAGRPVIVRTLDIGGDKRLAYLPSINEANPFLGTRGIRWAMRFPHIFRVQLRALLRAGLCGDLRIMLPMVSTPADVLWARAEIEAVANELALSGVDYRPEVPLGIMVETPAAAISLDRFRGIDFCSVGSNDLAQYVLAADRTDATLVQRYRSDDPAIFRLLRMVTATAARLALPVSLCGELAAEPQHAIALVGLGISTLSMLPAAIPQIREALQAVSLPKVKQCAAQACED
ncbi:MAG: phosphoenolpyruvate--protein phosphotransferase [Herpetosiphonaceae bacterium]|nr:phosphoenolpyruvate--protein phosphotransferase [Herpetosiphonaceae bacterium]